MYKLDTVLRWRKEGQAPFRSYEELQKMEEGLLQHGAAISIMHESIRFQAEFEGDDSILRLDHRKTRFMIFFHDHPEILSGDCGEKTLCDIEREARAGRINRQRIGYFPSELLHFLLEIDEEYAKKQEPWTWYVKALDELQAWTYLLYLNRVDESRRVFADLDNNKGYQFAQRFPVLKRQSAVLLKMMHQARK